MTPSCSRRATKVPVPAKGSGMIADWIQDVGMLLIEKAPIAAHDQGKYLLTIAHVGQSLLPDDLNRSKPRGYRVSTPLVRTQRKSRQMV